MPLSLLETIRFHAHALEPVPVALAPALSVLNDIHVVLFDVYGTLLISASGEVGTAVDRCRAESFMAALEAVGWSLPSSSGLVDDAVCQQAASTLLDAIHADHHLARERGIEYPEVDIVAIWRRTIEDLCERGLLDAAPDNVDLQRVALEYEVRTNPCWPMPGVVACLEALRARDLQLGIVSNAQFFTPLLFPALLSRSLEALGFSPRLRFYSYQVGRAKPGLELYERAAAAVAASGWRSHNVLFIGNDMLNDVAAARRVGFRTALFAGDGRSLRTRDGDPRVEGVRPDLVVTHLSQLVDCIA